MLFAAIFMLKVYLLSNVNDNRGGNREEASGSHSKISAALVIPPVHTELWDLAAHSLSDPVALERALRLCILS